MGTLVSFIAVSALMIVSRIMIATSSYALSDPPFPGGVNKKSSLLTAGVDLGTSGARLSIVESLVGDPSSRRVGVERFSAAMPWNNGRYDDPAEWLSAVRSLLRQAATSLDEVSTLQSICISGTSASCLIVDASNLSSVVRRPRMYDYAVAGSRSINILKHHAPSRHTTLSPTSSLSKLLDWHMDCPLEPHHRLLHQADYIIMNLLADRSSSSSSRSCYSDWHNCLKLGYDVRNLQWPSWLLRCCNALHLPTSVLPEQVVAPGTTIGTIDPIIAAELGLSTSCTLTAGTTDSNAAFMAAGTVGVGVAVTSLGSTLAIKQLSAVYVEDSTLGVYSHRFPSTEKELWLVGGASNVGCAVLRQQNYSDQELIECSKTIDPKVDTELQFYPLTRTGERFPVSDPNKKPCLEPVPNDRTAFLLGILQGISTVERDGYLALTALGASPPTTILTAGGGSRNPMWTEMRQRRLRKAFPNVIVKVADNTEASYGAALLAAAGEIQHIEGAQ